MRPCLSRDIDNHSIQLYNYETKRKRRIDYENKGIYRRKRRNDGT